MSGPCVCTECRHLAERLKKGLCESCYARQRRGTLAPPATSTAPLNTILPDMDAIDALIASCTIRRVEAISPTVTLERYANTQTGEHVERLTVCRKETAA